ncbi:MAG: ABC transporter transmembrane domain-containing protein, partial [Alphaproteobacteria bacterium]
MIKKTQKGEIKKSSFIRNYKRMWPFVKPYWFRALLATLITIPIGSLDAVIALMLKPYMDSMVMQEKGIESEMFGIPIPLLIILFTLLQSTLEYSSAYLNTWVGSKITMSLKEKMYSKLVHKESLYFDNNPTGEILMRYDGDPNTACSGLLNNLKIFTSRMFSSLSLIGVLLYTSWELAIIAIVVLGSSLYPLTKIRKKIKDVFDRSLVAGGAAVTILNETCAGNKTVASYNLQEYEHSFLSANKLSER